jgi:leucyl-tRNA synthetase
LKILHKTLQKVERDVENLSFNTAIAQMMILNNLCIKKLKVTKTTAETFVKMLSPYAPHLAEELWEFLGHTNTLAYEAWPAVEEKYLEESNFTYPVSFNGKKRFDLELPLDMTQNEMQAVVLNHPAAEKWLEGKAPKKIIIVHGKIINIVL